MKSIRGAGCLALLAFAFAVAPLGANAQATFPTKTVRILIGFAPGGPLDTIARAIAPKLADDLKQPVVVENRAGASGVIATETLARSAPDGYTLILNGITHAILPALNPKLPFDTLKDFTAVSIVGYGPLLLAVHPSVPATSLDQLLALARAQPGKFSYASAGNGTSPHIAVEMLKRAAKVFIVHLPYRGSAPAIADVIAGHVPIVIDVGPSALPHIKAGRVRAIVVSGQKRLADLPDVPTLAEAGFPEANLATWWGMFGPAQMPKAVVERLSLGFQRALQYPEVRARFATLGGDPVWTSPERFDQILRTDIARFATVVKEAGIKAD